MDRITSDMIASVTVASRVVSDKVEAFVEASDRLVNHLATTRPTGPAARRKFQQTLDEAYSRYDAARAALVGDPADDEEDDSGE